MPTNVSGRKSFTQNVAEQSGSTWLKGTDTVWSYNERSRTWPVAVKRSKPKIKLFQNGTPRSTTQVITRDSGYSRIINTFPKRRYTNTPVFGSFGDPVAVLNPPPFDHEKVYNVIRSKLRGEATNLGMMLAEYNKTAQLFLDLAQIVTTRGKSLVRKFPKHTNWARTDAYSQSMTDAYLAYTYGIKPTFSDLGNAVGEIISRMDRPLVLRGTLTRRASTSDSGLVPANDGVVAFSVPYSRVIQHRRRYQWLAEIDPDGIRSTLVTHGFANPLALGYELVPFSFVLDWWVNAGDVLASLDNLLICNRLLVQRSVFETKFLMIEATGSSVITQPGSAVRIERLSSRGTVDEISRVSTLRYKPSVSLKHITNGVALVNSIRKPIRKYYRSFNDLRNSDYTE